MSPLLVHGKKIPTAPYTPSNHFKEEIVPYNGAEFYTQFWPVVTGDVKGRILMVHGFSEGAGPYVKIFDDLVNNGYECFIFDQRGAALTSPEKTRGVTDEHHVFDDLEFFIKRHMDHTKNLFLGGHSMGGGIVLNYGIDGKYKGRLSGIFVTGPLIVLHRATMPNKLYRGTGEAVAKFWPTKKVDGGIPVKYITSDPQWQEYIVGNPLCTPLLGSLRQVSDMLARGESLLKKDRADKFDTVPLLILHGDDDKVSNYAIRHKRMPNRFQSNDPEASKKFFQMIPLKDKQLELIPGCRHTCFIESPEHYTKCLTLLLQWLDGHLE